MSIRTFNKLLSPGCLTTLSVGLLLAMAAGFLLQGGAGRGGGPQAQQLAQTIGNVDGYPIDLGAMERMVQAVQAQQGAGALRDPRAMIDSYGRVLTAQISLGLDLVEAKRKNITIADADIMQALNQQIDSQLMQLRFSLMQRGLLKPTATDADFEAAFKAQTGKSTAEVKATENADIKAKLSDPSVRAQLAGTVANTAIPNALAKKIVITDNDLKATYVKITAKRILFTGPTARADADKAEADLKAGTAFETLIDRYTKDPAGKNLKPSAINVSLVRDQLIAPGMSPILKAKPGEVTAPFALPEGLVIYKVLKSVPDVPKDFEKTKENLKKIYADSLGQEQYQKDLKALAGENLPKFSSAGWKDFYDYTKLHQDTAMSQADRTAKLATIAKAAEADTKSTSDALGVKGAIFAFFGAVDDQYLAATPSQKDSLAEARVGSVTAMNQYAISASLDLELADIYAKRKDSSNLQAMLMKASQDNTSFDAQGLSLYKQVKAKTNGFVADKTLTAEAGTQINIALKQWMDAKTSQDKEMAEVKRREVTAQKEANKERKAFELKRKAEALKAKTAVPVDRATLPVGPPTSAPATKP